MFPCWSLSLLILTADCQLFRNVSFSAGKLNCSVLSHVGVWHQPLRDMWRRRFKYLQFFKILLISISKSRQTWWSSLCGSWWLKIITSLTNFRRKNWLFVIVLLNWCSRIPKVLSAILELQFPPVETPLTWPKTYFTNLTYVSVEIHFVIKKISLKLYVIP